MKLTEIYFYRKSDGNNTELAKVALVFDRVFRLKRISFRYFPIERSYCLLFPAKKDSEGKHKDIFHPLTSDFYYDTLAAVIQEWQRWQADETLRMKLA